MSRELIIPNPKLKLMDQVREVMRRRCPGRLIDFCASGGRRNDLETLRRAVPLLRGDYQSGHEATTLNQGHTHGNSSWIKESR